jgi:hypothetical protein
MEPMSCKQMLRFEKAASKRFQKAAALQGTDQYKMHCVGLADVPRPKRKRTATQVFGAMTTRTRRGPCSKRVEVVPCEQFVIDVPVEKPSVESKPAKVSRKRQRRLSIKDRTVTYPGTPLTDSEDTSEGDSEDDPIKHQRITAKLATTSAHYTNSHPLYCGEPLTDGEEDGEEAESRRDDDETIPAVRKTGFSGSKIGYKLNDHFYKGEVLKAHNKDRGWFMVRFDEGGEQLWVQISPCNRGSAWRLEGCSSKLIR